MTTDGPPSTAATARVETWASLTSDQPMPGISRRRIIGEHLMVSSVVLEPGFFVETHRHANEQFVCVLSGRVRFVLHEGTPAERTVVLGAGQVLVLPPNVPHSARALERTEIWDLFSPPSATTGIDRPAAPRA